MDYHPLENLHQIPQKQLVSRCSHQRKLLIYRDGQEISVFKDSCSHQTIPLSSFGCLREDGLHCEAHGAVFDPISGAVLKGPAQTPLHRYPTRIQEQQLLVAFDD